MDSIPDMFHVVTKAQNHGVEGYYVQNKYFDARRSKEQKTLELSRDKSASLAANPNIKKSSYLDEIMKKASKLPGPTTYDPKQILSKPTTNIKVESPRRKTIFDEMQTYQKKRNVPAAGKYDKIDVIPDKSKLKSNLSKAEVNTYLDNSMRASIECPGVGAYNAKIEILDHRGPKWTENKGKKSQSERNMKFPPVGTYNPLPIQYSLFDNLSGRDKLKQKSHFPREQRFKSSKSKPVPFYNVGSEWGMKDKLTKKDILSRIGSSLTHHSVYY